MKHLVYLLTALLLALSPLGMKAQEEIGAGQVAADTVDPKPLNLDIVKAAIGYPPLAREAEIEGLVLVKVLVDSKGNYVRHVVI